MPSCVWTARSHTNPFILTKNALLFWEIMLVWRIKLQNNLLKMEAVGFWFLEVHKWWVAECIHVLGFESGKITFPELCYFRLVLQDLHCTKNSQLVTCTALWSSGTFYLFSILYILLSLSENLGHLSWVRLQQSQEQRYPVLQVHAESIGVSIIHQTLTWIFNVRTWSFLCMRTHTGVGHSQQKVSTTFWLRKTHKFCLCSWRGSNLGSVDLESDTLPTEPPRHPWHGYNPQSRQGVRDRFSVRPNQLLSVHNRQCLSRLHVYAHAQWLMRMLNIPHSSVVKE